MCVCTCGQLYNPLCFITIFNNSGIFWIFHIFLLKSSDLSINPHISLNPWNPQIHGAILGFPEDIYCEIHGFHGQSSDLVEDFLKSSSRSEVFILFCLGVSVIVGTVIAFYTICLSHWHAETCRCCVRIESWTLMNTDLKTYLNTDLCWVIFFNFWSLFIQLIMKSLCLGWNPQISW